VREEEGRIASKESRGKKKSVSLRFNSLIFALERGLSSLWGGTDEKKESGASKKSRKSEDRKTHCRNMGGDTGKPVWQNRKKRAEVGNDGKKKSIKR